VIEQEAGVAEFDAKKRALIWGLTGGEQRAATGLADACVQDDTLEVKATVARLFAQGLPKQHRSERADDFLARLARVDTAGQPAPEDVRNIYQQGDA